MNLIRFFCLILIAGSSQAQSGIDTTLTVYFDYGKYEADDLHMTKLFLELNQTKFTLLSISGHTDSAGSFQQNDYLSMRRTKFVITYLKAHFEINNNYVLTNYGKRKPKSFVDNSLNRCVDIHLLFGKDSSVITRNDSLIIFKVLTFDKIYFRPDEPVITPASLLYVDYIVDILKNYKDAYFEIRGHVNWNMAYGSEHSSGYKKKMDDLSTARAKTVCDQLIEKGIAADRISYKGMGNTQMIYPDAKNDEEKQKNMRVEVFILKKSY